MDFLYVFTHIDSSTDGYGVGIVSYVSKYAVFKYSGFFVRVHMKRGQNVVSRI